MTIEQLVPLLIAVIALAVAILRKEVKREEVSIDDTQNKNEMARFILGQAEQTTRLNERLLSVESQLMQSKYSEALHIRQIGDLDLKVQQSQSEIIGLTNKVSQLQLELKNCVEGNATKS